MGIWASGRGRWTEMQREREKKRKKKPRSTSFRATKTDGCSCFSITCVNSMREASKAALKKKCILDLGGFRMMEYMRRVFFLNVQLRPFDLPRTSSPNTE